MKHSKFLSLTAAISLAACHDATAPELKSEPVDAPATAALVPAVDSSALWASLALDDAATRLLSGLPDGGERTKLQRSLNALSALLVRGVERDAALTHQDVAARALAELRERSDEAVQPDFDAIELALDGAFSVLEKTKNTSRR